MVDINGVSLKSAQELRDIFNLNDVDIVNLVGNFVNESYYLLTGKLLDLPGKSNLESKNLGVDSISLSYEENKQGVTIDDRKKKREEQFRKVSGLLGDEELTEEKACKIHKNICEKIGINPIPLVELNGVQLFSAKALASGVSADDIRKIIKQYVNDIGYKYDLGIGYTNTGNRSCLIGTVDNFTTADECALGISVMDKQKLADRQFRRIVGLSEDDEIKQEHLVSAYEKICEAMGCPIHERQEAVTGAPESFPVKNDNWTKIFDGTPLAGIIGFFKGLKERYFSPNKGDKGRENGE